MLFHTFELSKYNLFVAMLTSLCGKQMDNPLSFIYWNALQCPIFCGTTSSSQLKLFIRFF